jgi:hypothetical protein
MTISSVKTGAIGDSLLAGNAAFIPNSFESIATATGTGSSGTITFSSIPSTYAALQVRFIARDTGAGTTTNIVSLNLNGDGTTSNYARHTLYGNGTSVAAEGSTSSVQLGPWCVNGGALASTIGVGIIDIQDYASTSKNTTVRAFGGANNNSTSTSFETGLTSILWKNTSAVNSLSLVCGNNFATSTVVSLYGIKGA